MTRFLESFKRFSTTILLLGVVVWMILLVLGQLLQSWVVSPPDFKAPVNVIHTEEIPTISADGCIVIDSIEVCGATMRGPSR